MGWDGMIPWRAAKPWVKELKIPMSHERYIQILVQVTVFPQEWLTRRDKIQISQEWSIREWGICISSQLLSHELGNIETRTRI